MSRKHILVTLALAIALGPMSAAFAYDASAVPSTNDANAALGWAHVVEIDVGIGYVTLEFVSARNFWSCFEYRTDGDTSQVIPENGGVNYNPEIDDGLYPYVCQKNNSSVATIPANGYVEVRMVFGAEKDERFDWTRFDVLPDAGTKDDCKNGGWRDFGFRNQGQCIRFVLTGQDSR